MTEIKADDIRRIALWHKPPGSQEIKKRHRIDAQIWTKDGRSYRLTDCPEALAMKILKLFEDISTKADITRMG